MKTTPIIIAAIVLSLCAGSCRSDNESTATQQLASIYTFTPKANTNVITGSYTSTIEEGKSVNAAFKIGGQIKRIAADEGNYVRKGQIVAYLDDVDYKLQLDQLETQYAQVSSEIKRIEAMHSRNGVSDNDYEKAKAGLQQLKIQLDMVKNQLSYTRLQAPVSGYVVERYMEEGEMVGAGTPVLKIMDDSGVETSVALSADAYAKRDQIVKCEGHSAVTGQSAIPLDIIGFIPDGDSNSLFKLRLKIPDTYRNKLLPGMNMSVKIVYDSDEGLDRQPIPSRALFEREGKTYVWSVNEADSTLSACEVNIAGTGDGRYMPVSGLNAGQTIVAAGVHHLHENQKVNIIGAIEDLKEKAAL